MNEKKSLLILVVVLLIALVVTIIITTSQTTRQESASNNVINDVTNIKNEVENNTEKNSVIEENTIENLVTDNNNTENTNVKTSSKTYSFVNKYGDGTKSIEIEADEVKTGGGYTGAASNIYYINNGELFHLELANLEIEKLATGVINFEEALDGLIVKVREDYEVLKESTYITYEK